MVFTFGSHTFRSKKDAQQAVQHVLRNTPLGSSLPEVDFKLISELVSLHPNARHKIGEGIKEIRVVSNQPPYTSRGFWIYRVDGTDTDFSYLRCLNPSSRDRVLKALRLCVNSQIIAFRENLRWPTICALTGESITVGDIDHDPAFLDLVLAWTATIGEEIENIPLLSEDGNMGPQLARDDHSASFYTYHQQHASLRVISLTAHRTRNASQTNKRIKPTRAEREAKRQRCIDGGVG